MAFDPIIACLQQITDYPRYERFCTDLMRFDGYLGIEPLGGVADKNRDSILLHNGGEVIFHYSVRKDWKAKLWKDAEGARKHGHACTKVVCVNPAEFTTTERDNCIAEFGNTFGLPLDLYGVERMASMLRTNAAALLRAYPQIFVPHLVEANRTAQVDVRINPTRDKRQQLAQIVAYNRGPGPVLIEAWYACWKENDSPRMSESMQCYRGRLPIRLEEKSKLDITVSFDFAWEGLERVGLADAEKRHYDATQENVKTFVRTAQLHMPPPRTKVDDAPTLEQLRAQDVFIVLQRDRSPGSKHDRLVLVFRNNGDLPLKTVGATIGWKFDTDRALAEEAHLTGPKVVESGANVNLRRITQADTSSNGSEVRFVLDDGMANLLVEVITRTSEIVAVEAAVHIAPAFKITETDNMREVVMSVAQSVLDSWD